MIIIKENSSVNKNLKEVIDFFSNDVNFNSITDIKSSLSVLQTLCYDISWLTEYARKYSLCDLEDSEILNGKLMTSNSFFIPTGSKKYTMRWNYWEAQSNHENSESKKIKFATDLMHNHDYHLLTACVLGSGYNTDMYKIEDVPKRLSVGDPIDLIHLGEHNLKQGTAMFMEANTEFHSQKLPVEASVTVNIMINSCFGEQYCLSEDDNSFIVSNILKTNETRREKISKAVERFLSA